jgi:CDP-diacylglycerol--glycerol-3-phosphate 3-phosphatidyltransferase
MHLKKLIHNLILKMNLNPNFITIIGSIGAITGSVLLIFDIRLLGIIFIVLFSFFDAIDGTIARILNKESSLGKFLDSNLDRFVDTSIFLAILSQINQNELFEIYFVFLGLALSLITSYIKASSESLGINIKSGPLSRLPRIILLILAIILQQYLFFLTIIIVLSGFTVLIRLISGIKQLIEKDKIVR